MNAYVQAAINCLINLWSEFKVRLRKANIYISLKSRQLINFQLMECRPCSRRLSYVGSIFDKKVVLCH